MDYNVTFNVPASYLGNDVSNLIANLSEQEKHNITVPVTANVLGSFTKPTVKTDMKQAISSLTNQLVEAQKNKLLDKGKNELTKLLNGDKKTDSTKTNKNNVIKNTANTLLNGLFKKKKKDTVN